MEFPSSKCATHSDDGESEREEREHDPRGVGCARDSALLLGDVGLLNQAVKLQGEYGQHAWHDVQQHPAEKRKQEHLT